MIPEGINGLRPRLRILGPGQFGTMNELKRRKHAADGAQTARGRFDDPSYSRRSGLPSSQERRWGPGCSQRCEMNGRTRYLGGRLRGSRGDRGCTCEIFNSLQGLSKEEVDELVEEGVL
jgi:hypothetical protein